MSSDAQSGTAMVQIQEIQAAIQRCMDQQPPEQPAYRLSKDASRLAEVYGVMIGSRQEAVALASLTDVQREALARWCGPANGTGTR